MTTLSQWRSDLVGREGRVRAARDDDLAAAPELGGEAVGLGREAAEERQRDQVGVGVEIDRLDLLVDHAHAVPRRGDRRQVNAGDRRHEVHLVPPLVALDVDDDDVDLHRDPLLGGEILMWASFPSSTLL